MAGHEDDAGVRGRLCDLKRSSRDVANGFSTRRCLPALAAIWLGRTWSPSAVVMLTACTSCHRAMSSQDVLPTGMPYFWHISWTRASLREHTAATSTPGQSLICLDVRFAERPQSDDADTDHSVRPPTSLSTSLSASRHAVMSLSVLKKCGEKRTTPLTGA